jgi:hypothetical protein
MNMGEKYKWVQSYGSFLSWFQHTYPRRQRFIQKCQQFNRLMSFHKTFLTVSPRPALKETTASSYHPGVPGSIPGHYKKK